MANLQYDDDAPPPLSSLSEQVEALRIRRQEGAETSSSRSHAPQTQLRVASCIITEDCIATEDGPGGGPSHPQPAKAGQIPSKPAIKKGFFDKPAAKKASTSAQTSESAADSMPLLKGQQRGMPGSGPNIPDFLRVQPDENEKKYMEMRSKLVDALKPDAKTIASISMDPNLMSGFDDPEVMAAVNDIAKHPENFRKYQTNKKVQAFYSAMGGVMGQRLETMGPQQPARQK